MNHPKMLYKGNTANYQHIIAEDQVNEDELKDQGYVEFDQLKEPAVDGSVGVSSAEVPTKNLNAVAEKLAEVEQERDQLKVDIEHLNAVIERGSAENVQLHEQLKALSAPSDISQDVESQGPDLSKYTQDQLRKLLDEKGVKYLARDSKPELIALLNNN